MQSGNTVWGNVPFCVERCVILSRHQNQILKTIVVSDTINMMYNFSFGERSSNVLGHYQGVFRNIATFVCIGMIWCFGKYISHCCLVSPAIPSWIMFAFWKLMMFFHARSITCVARNIKQDAT